MSVPAIKKIVNYFLGENEELEEQDYSEEYNQVDYDYEEENETAGETLSIFKRKQKVVPMQQQQIKMKMKLTLSFLMTTSFFLYHFF